MPAKKTAPKSNRKYGNKPKDLKRVVAGYDANIKGSLAEDFVVSDLINRGYIAKRIEQRAQNTSAPERLIDIYAVGSNSLFFIQVKSSDNLKNRMSDKEKKELRRVSRKYGATPREAIVRTVGLVPVELVDYALI